MQVAARHGPGTARGSGPPFIPSVPLDLVLVPVTEEHGIDVIDEIGHGELRVGRGKPVSVGQREGRGDQRGKDTDRAVTRCLGQPWTCHRSQITRDTHTCGSVSGLLRSVVEPKGRRQETGPRSDGHNAGR